MRSLSRRSLAGAFASDSPAVTVVLVVAALVANFVFLLLIRTAYLSAEQAGQRRAETLRLVSDLQNESLLLRRLVSAYTGTAAPRYLLYYYDLLAIREGSRPQPEGAEPLLYWNEVIAGLREAGVRWAPLRAWQSLLPGPQARRQPVQPAAGWVPDPGQVVLAKSGLGVVATFGLAWGFGETAPPLASAVALLAIGASGYGLSLRFYLLAQRTFGAARTGSVFAFAPFLGAMGAWGLGERSGTWLMLLGGALMLGGVVLHLVETHEHEHTHLDMEHEHAHTHDDGHHEHAHTPMPVGPHSHRHRHAFQTHRHPHAPDAHHLHGH